MEQSEKQHISENDMEAVGKLRDGYERIKKELHKVIVGQDKVIDELLVAMFACGHCLIEGVPGLAKTLMVSTLAKSLSLSFSRIQFTPDLMPSDITGTEVIEEDRATGQRHFRFFRGPIFANVILADEINRTPPKTQAALLEAMQERQVTIAGKRNNLEEPFFVLATQNPIEQEGTYPLPEAQLDRFMFKIIIDYPAEQEELDIIRLTTAAAENMPEPVLTGDEIVHLQEIVRRVPVSDHVAKYAMKLSRATRPTQDDPPEFVKRWISWGAGPRASQYLVLAGKARAILQGRFYVASEDIRFVAYPILRHRIISNFNAEAEGISSDDLVEKLISLIPRVENEKISDGRLPKIFGSEDSVESDEAGRDRPADS